jgi:hypothetical protein
VAIATPHTTSPRFPRAWPLLFPLTFLVHILEEYFGGFPAWSAQHLGFRLNAQGFLAINEFAWAGMLCAAVAATVAEPAQWLVIPLATVTAVNGAAHLVFSVVTRTYSPGVVSGTALWLPLGIVTLTRAYRSFPRAVFAAGVAVGLAMHATVILIARAG